jgi:hypothetical protein
MDISKLKDMSFDQQRRQSRERMMTFTGSVLGEIGL